MRTSSGRRSSTLLQKSGTVLYINPAKRSFSEVLDPSKVHHLQSIVRRIELWYRIFNPKYQHQHTSVVHHVVHYKEAHNEIVVAGIVKHWFCLLLTSKRWSIVHNKMPSSNRTALSKHETSRIIPINEMQLANGTKLQLLDEAHEWHFMTIAQILSMESDIKDMSTEELLDYLMHLPTLCIRIDASSKAIAQEKLKDECPPNHINHNCIRHDDTLLHYFIATRPNLSSSIVHTFFNHGISNTVLGNEGRSLVHAAAAQGHLNTIHILMAKGCQLVARDDFGATPFHVAAMSGHVHVLQYFVDTVHVHVNIVNSQGRTALHYAAENNQIGALEFLISKGADVNAKNGNDRTPLHMAIPSGHFDTVKYLLNNNAAILKNIVGNTIVHDAAQHNQLRLVEYFVSLPHFACYATDMNHAGQTPLHVAAASGSIDVYLLLNGNPWGGKHAGLIQDEQGMYPLSLLIESQALNENSNLTSFVPRNAKSDELPLWNDKLFVQVLHQSPSFAWQFLDVFKMAISWSSGRTEYKYSNINLIYGNPRDIESSALYSVLKCYDDPNKEKRTVGMRLLTHPILTRIMHIKWKSFGRTMYFVELFCSLLLLLATMVCVILSKDDKWQSIEQFHTTLFFWTLLFTYSLGAIYVVIRYEHIKKSLRQSQLFEVPNSRVQSVRALFIQRAHRIVILVLEWLQGSHFRLLKHQNTQQTIERHHNVKSAANKQKLEVADAMVVQVLAITLLFASIVAATIVVSCFISTKSPLSQLESQLRDTNMVIRLVLAITLLGFELLELKGSPKRYLESSWNYFLVPSYLTLIFVGTPLDAGWINPPTADVQPCIFAVITLLLWINFLQILRVHRWTGPMITMVLRMLSDVRNFMIMYSVFQMGLSCCYYALLKGEDGFESFSSTFVSTYFIMFAEIPPSLLSGQSYPKQYFVTACLVFHCFTVNIVLLNALIAAFTTTSNDVLEQVKEQVLYNHAESILRSEIILPQWCQALYIGITKQSFAKNVFVLDDSNITVATQDNFIAQLNERMDKCMSDVTSLRQELAATKDAIAQHANKTQETLNILVAMLKQVQFQDTPRISRSIIVKECLDK